ncbi:Zn-dependent protease [Sediminihabitans luteus]|uniref:Zinc metalloprotease n=1 Tax=Sediminihabitans luteus TaxID=1138585 RepID=A0A2M9CR31_9CELL|nr:site-2 protease family protein [Sediminihabitans luteus]PJJ74364.1 Zn-dependent protease [Sediminihabitans luteus]GIJ00270.1 peptidase M50 [Sediminihabitans luteus]
MTHPAPAPGTPTSGRRAPEPARSRGWVIGRIADAPVIITPSWAIAAVVLTLLFAPQVARVAPYGGAQVYVVSFAFVLLLFASVFLHEVAHALVARALGHRVTELALTVWGGHTAYTGTTRRPRDAFWIAVVGPLTNIVLAVGFFALYRAEVGSVTVWLLCYAAAFSNAFVGFFNLVPGLPLDGGQVLESAVWAGTGSRDRGTVVAGWTGRAVAVGLVLLALGIPVAQGRSPDLFIVLWTALIASFLWQGASAAVAVGRAREQVAHLQAASFVRPHAVVTVHATVADVAHAASAVGAYAVLVVDDAGRPVAVVEPSTAGAVPAEALARTPVGAVAVPLPVGVVVDVALHGHALVTTVLRAGGGAGVLPAVHEGRLVGVVMVADVATAVRSAHR